MLFGTRRLKFRRSRFGKGKVRVNRFGLFLDESHEKNLPSLGSLLWSWMRCYTQEEIAQEERLTHQAVDLILHKKMADLPEFAKPAANHLVDFKRPGYNVWCCAALRFVSDMPPDG